MHTMQTRVASNYHDIYPTKVIIPSTTHCCMRHIGVSAYNCDVLDLRNS